MTAGLSTSIHVGVNISKPGTFVPVSHLISVFTSLVYIDSVSCALEPAASPRGAPRKFAGPRSHQMDAPQHPIFVSCLPSVVADQTLNVCSVLNSQFLLEHYLWEHRFGRFKEREWSQSLERAP